MKGRNNTSICSYSQREATLELKANDKTAEKLTLISKIILQQDVPLKQIMIASYETAIMCPTELQLPTRSNHPIQTFIPG